MFAITHRGAPVALCGTLAEAGRVLAERDAAACGGGCIELRRTAGDN